MRPRRLHVRAMLLLLTGVLILSAVPARAQSGEADIKAAFIYNFAKFVEWPADSFASDGGRLQLCTLGDSPLAQKLRQLHGREAQGRAIEVRVLARSEDWPGCHMLFVASPGETPRHPHNSSGNPAAVLTISEALHYTRQGGMISLFVEANRVQFAVNLPAAQQAGLKLSARLLQLARNVSRGE